MKLQIARPEDNSVFTALSSFVFALVLVLVLVTPFVEMTGVPTAQQQSWRLYGYGVAGLLQAALVVMRGWRRSLRIVTAPVSLFVLWCVLSLAWTQHVDLTGKRLVLLALVYGGVFAGVCDLRTQRSLGIVRIVLTALLVLNFAVAIALPDIGTQATSGMHLWRGVMGHKNIAGMLCAITVILFAFEAGKIAVAARAAAIAATVVFLYLTASKTAWGALPVALAAGGGIVLLGRGRPSAHQASASQASVSEAWRRPVMLGSLGVFGLVMLALIVMTWQQDALLSLTDNTSSLTGRTAIWRPMIQFYLDHPMLGSGYGAYWDASASLVDAQAQNAEMWKNVDQGHNGYLDLLVQVGLPGLALALYAAFVWPMGQLVAMIAGYPRRAALIVALLVFFLIENFSESSLFADDTVGNGFLLLALAYTQRFAMLSGRSQRTGARGSAMGGGSKIDAAQLREKRQQRQGTADT